MTDLLDRLTRGLPVTFIAALALVVLGAWLVGGVGRAAPRIAFGVPWLLAFIGCWGLVLYGSDSSPNNDSVLWVTYALTAMSFILPIACRRFQSKP